MKKLTLLLLASAIFAGCSKEITGCTIQVLTYKDGVLISDVVKRTYRTDQGNTTRYVDGLEIVTIIKCGK